MHKINIRASLGSPGSDEESLFFDVSVSVILKYVQPASNTQVTKYKCNPDMLSLQMYLMYDLINIFSDMMSCP